MFKDQVRWNSPDVDKGNSAVWHEMYSLPYTEVLGFVACRTTSKILGMGSAERHWGDVKHLKSGKRSHLGAEKTEKQSMIYTKAKLDKAKVLRDEMDKIDSAVDAWGDEDEKFDLGLEKFGVDIEALKPPPVPKRLFRCWIEDWEAPLLKKNDPVAKAKLLEKYHGLVFQDIDLKEKILYTVSSEHLDFEKGRNGGWAVLAEPPDYDGDENNLEPFQINEDSLCYMIKRTPQPSANNVKLIRKEGEEETDTDYDIEGDDEDDEDDA